MSWHESWESMKGKGRTIACLRAALGRGVKSFEVMAARKATGVLGLYRHGRYEYTNEEFEKILGHLKENPWKTSADG